MEILILAGLILVNGVFAMSEVALLTARMPRLSALANQGDALATAAVKLSKEPTRFLSTIQIGITVIGLLNGIVGEAAFAPQLSAWFQSLGLEPRISSITATAVVVIAVTYFSIVIGELVPKRLGQHNAEDIARLVAWPMRSLAAITGPFVRLLSASTDALLKPLLRLLGIRHQESGSQPLSLEEIRTIVLESSNVLPKKHMSILVNLFDLEAVTVDDVMVPRSQIEAINLDAPLEELAQQIATAYHRRLLVYDGRLDEIVGTLRVRNALTLMQRGELRKETLREIVREPYFIPSGTALFSQLQSFQEQQDRVSLVVDEYGELMGLVTLEDILEEIIGEFTTQSPLQTRGFVRQSDGSYLIEGGALLRELNRKLGFHFPLDGPKTLNGLVLEHLRDIPEPNTSLKIADHYLEIVQTQDRVVKAVRVLAPSVEKSATGS
ncbi:MAG TPA: CNNM domain-containing protein [Burkholderiales bacterium]|jgi:Mg2+/Co2+ transporter CorB|nr:CNNM domain-containing protein [Burkholderiales bacterium]